MRMIAARVGNDTVAALFGRQCADRRVGASQFEGARWLQRLGLDQQWRIDPGEGDERRMNRYAAQPIGGDLNLSYRHKVRHGSTLRVRVVIDRCRSKHYDKVRNKIFAESEENSDVLIFSY
ncbi:MAG TPA: hypothetical protein VFW16_02400 [Streptosporangiaceae bacterium]|nr:hypothetical protein [Streptosporangiaceae bacterium]